MGNSKIVINWDFDDNLLQMYYPYDPKNYKNTWRMVKSFFYQNGFEPHQYSSVVSCKPMSRVVGANVVRSLFDTYEWLCPCVQRMNITNVPRDLYDVSFLASEKMKDLDLAELLNMRDKISKSR